MRIEKLSGAHDCSLFDCGENYQALNLYIKQYASQSDRRHNTSTYVLVPEDSSRVIGYYTTTVKSLEAEVVPEAEKLRGYPMPVALLARLAVDKTFQGHGVGSILLVDALRRIYRAAQEVGIRAIEVDAKDERARQFYERYGFVSLLDDKQHLYLTIKTLAKTRIGQGIVSSGGTA